MFGAVWTDHWKPYESFVPLDIHGQSKAKTWMVEGFNMRLRHDLARLRRKTVCFSKSMEMLEISLKLLFSKLNGEEIKI